MRVVVDPELSASDYRERQVTQHQIRAVFGNEQQIIIKDEIVNLVNDF